MDLFIVSVLQTGQSRRQLGMEQDFVGTKRWLRPATPYEVYMEEQNLPIHRGAAGFRACTLSRSQVQAPLHLKSTCTRRSSTCSKGAVRRRSGAARMRTRNRPSSGRRV